MNPPVRTADGNTLILYVGHTVPRTEEAMLDALMVALKTEPLDPVFHDSFVDPVVFAPRDGSDLDAWAGARVFFGNFLSLSRAFRLMTRDTGVAALLDSMIRANMATPGYQRARAEHLEFHAAREAARVAARVARAGGAQ